MLRCAITPGELAGIADAQQRSQAAAALIARSRELCADGVEIVLVREKDLPIGELVRLVRSVIAAAAQTGGARVLVAQRLDVALAAGASGVHLSSHQGELTPAQVRCLLPEAFVSMSCHTVEEVRRAVGLGANAILFAPVFGKWVQGKQVGEAQGLHNLAQAVAAAGKVPVVALGGVNAANAQACVQSGAAGVAAIRWFFPGTAVPPVDLAVLGF